MTELPIDENTPRILIVEDEPKLGQLLIDYLRAASYAPSLISHGDQVLAYVRQTPPDLILLDLMLPGTDGLTLCREIRRFSDVPIVMVTAKIEEIDRLLGLEIGADDYICKPYSPSPPHRNSPPPPRPEPLRGASACSSIFRKMLPPAGAASAHPLPSGMF